MMVRTRQTIVTMVALMLAGGLAAPAVFASPADSRAPVAAPAGDGAQREMTRAQARRAYLDAVCPANQALNAIGRAMGTPGVEWSTLQPLVRDVARTQFRGARVISDPARPWPADVRALIPAVAVQYNAFGGVYSVLESADSVEMFESLSRTAQADTLPAFAQIQEANGASVRRIRARLGLPANGGCSGR